MPPLPQHVKSRLDLWPALWPTDLNINRDHQLIKDYLPTKFEASWAKCSWVISCTMCGRLTWLMTFDLLTWKSTGIIYLSWTIYIQSSKLVGQSIVELSVAQGIGHQHDLWPTDLNINRIIFSSRTIYLSSLKLLGQSVLSYQLHKVKGDRHTDRQTDGYVQHNMPSLFKGGIII